ncbi:mandelate racemase/muconate lactonizing enzyme family protein [Bryobacter aggregatus]|uniref:mandelate racemase/muconate lactonizing enzyme family protein n=1 Tax=Bryobacter aggregatus TaxID=360054 RepID=UPI000AA8598F|nr:mandelate racemase/muconate lactonizing enzyme family protein [Bryobacter aggregatus]
MTQRLSRRTLLALPFAIHASAKTTEVRVKEIRASYEDFVYRTPIKFGGNIVDKVTMLNVHTVIEDGLGKSQKGFSSMSMGNVWSFPSKVMNYNDTLGAMKSLAAEVERITNASKATGHPIDISVALEDQFLAAAAEISRNLKEPIPKLCSLVVMSPFDAAIHDAYGKLLNRSSYQTYGKDCMRKDLSHYLGKGFEGEYLSQYVTASPKATMPLYHLVGAVDPIERADIKQKVGDGLPETFHEWIVFNGLRNIKIKLNGEDNKWDQDRILAVHRACLQTMPKIGRKDWVYSLDFNEKCPNVAYLIEVLKKVQASDAIAYQRIQYIEQPTKRDLKADRANVMHEAAKLKPVVIDESLTDQETLMYSRDLGYSGAALKACKGQSQALLMAAVAQKYKMFLCVQDLTCPGASLIHSAGLAAHVPGVAAIEANARQYCPVANRAWESRFPGIFNIKDGLMKTGTLTGNGLSAIA